LTGRAWDATFGEHFTAEEAMIIDMSVSRVLVPEVTVKKFIFMLPVRGLGEGFDALLASSSWSELNSESLRIMGSLQTRPWEGKTFHGIVCYDGDDYSPAPEMIQQTLQSLFPNVLRRLLPVGFVLSEQDMSTAHYYRIMGTLARSPSKIHVFDFPHK